MSDECLLLEWFPETHRQPRGALPPSTWYELSWTIKDANPLLYGMALDEDSKKEILNEISAIRALLTRLQSSGGGQQQNTAFMHENTTGGGEKRVLVLF